MLGKILGHYRIVEKIGAGGMGVVYAAHDEHLDRNVALKVLGPGALSDESVRRRFRNEAHTISKLNHPNIATVHDFDSQEGTDFLVMEFVAGVTLNQRIAAGPMPEKDVLRLGMQLVQGLIAAHASNVIHRDLKPSNLRVTPDGRLKILDFGLAKTVGALPGTTDTASIAETGWVAGTLPYMAPEQVRNEVLDARTDVYAAGAVLYEMATGQRPFPQTGPVLVDHVLNRPPTPPRTVNPLLSIGLDAVIVKALDKDPDRRYQSAKELLVDLERVSEGLPAAAVETPSTAERHPFWRKWPVMVAVGALLLAAAVGGWRFTHGARAARIQSIAVLPLENLSGDPDQAYFVDGMTEELINKLAKVGALRVISRTSAMRYKGVHKPLPEIARELDVDAVIEGSVLHSGDRVRITADLIQASTDKTLWSNSYQREVRDILSLQSEVAAAIADEIRVTVQPHERLLLTTARPVNPEAYEAYLKGRYFWNRRSAENIEKSIEYFQQAVTRDPDYALAYSGLADAYHVLWVYTNTPPRQNYAAAKAAAMKALELDDNLAEAHTSLAAVLMDDEWDFAGAERQFRRALALNPNYSTARQWLGQYFSYLGRFDDAVAEMKKGLQVDPMSPILNTEMGDVLLLARKYDDAIDPLKKAIELDQSFYLAHVKLRDAYLGKAAFAAAIAEDELAATLGGVGQEGARSRAELLRRGFTESGADGFWRARLKWALQHHQENVLAFDTSAYMIASIYAHLRESELAFSWLEKAFEQRDDNIFYFSNQPEFDHMRQDPHGRDLVRRMGLPSH